MGDRSRTAAMSSWRIRPGMLRAYGLRRATSWHTSARGGRVSDLLVLWDLDGTLLNAGGVGAELYTMVFDQLFGRSLDALAPMAGRTDRAIILETLELAGIAEPRRYVDPFIAGLTVRAPSVREAIALQGRALPGAIAALAALAALSSGRDGAASAP